MIRFCSVLKNLLFLLLIVSLVACRNERDSNRQEINSAPVTSDSRASDPSASDLVYSISNYEATFEVVANETEELKNLDSTAMVFEKSKKTSSIKKFPMISPREIKLFFWSAFNTAFVKLSRKLKIMLSTTIKTPTLS